MPYCYRAETVGSFNFYAFVFSVPFEINLIAVEIKKTISRIHMWYCREKEG
jgi:hypothetical protein